jgi:hypothetical protein
VDPSDNNEGGEAGVNIVGKNRLFSRYGGGEFGLHKVYVSRRIEGGDRR